VIPGGVVPALVGSLAISPDNTRLAYTTAPCATSPRPLPRGVPDHPSAALPGNASLTVLEMTTGAHRTWTTDRPSVVGEIVWAADGATLGYTVAEVHPVPQGDPSQPPGDIVDTLTMRTLDTGSAGTDLLAGPALFHQPDGASVTSAIMNLDGHTGVGTMRQASPPAIATFDFAAGQPIVVTHTFPITNRDLYSITLGDRNTPRYACLDGVDPFGRLIQGTLTTTSPRPLSCGTAYDTPR